jgi:hypothetical protein
MGASATGFTAFLRLCGLADAVVFGPTPGAAWGAVWAADWVACNPQQSVAETQKMANAEIRILAAARFESIANAFARNLNGNLNPAHS